MRKAITVKTRSFVAQRTNRRCEYCRFHEDDLFLSFEIDHVVSVKHGGGNEPDNLAYACSHSNNHKGSDMTTFLDDYDDIEILFNPRKHDWQAHFAVSDGEILARTRIGQATVKLLRLNEPDRLILRQLLTQTGRFTISP